MDRVESTDGSPAPAPRVLVIDDDAMTRETFQHMLTANGYVAQAVPSVADGLNCIRTQAPDAVLLDFHMPLADGLQGLRSLRSEKTHSHVPVAVITGNYFIDECVAAELNQLGTRIYFKPVWEDDLVRIVGELLEHSVPMRHAHGR